MSILIECLRRDFYRYISAYNNAFVFHIVYHVLLQGVYVEGASIVCVCVMGCWGCVCVCV